MPQECHYPQNRVFLEPQVLTEGQVPQARRVRLVSLDLLGLRVHLGDLLQLVTATVKDLGTSSSLWARKEKGDCRDLGERRERWA